MNRTIFSLVFILLSIIGCQEAEQVSSDSKTKTTKPFDENSFTVGKSLFNEKCLKCHAIGKKDGFNMNFWARVPGERKSTKLEWLEVYLSNSDSLAQYGDAYTVVLKEEYNNVNSHNFKLSPKQVKQVVYFMNNYDSAR